MSYLSEKQNLYKDYLIKKLGFIDDPFLKDYTRFLEIVSPRFKLLGKQKKIWNEVEQKYFPEKPNPFNPHIETDNYFIPTDFNIIDLLNIELNIKKNSEYIQKKIQLAYISATDISNFTYCPVSFAISKTFELPKYESAILGTAQHEKHSLINYLQPFKIKEDVYKENEYLNSIEVEKTLDLNPLLTDENQFFFNELSVSSIVFYGHESKEIEKSFFKSSKGNFVGQPDYIFRNNNTLDTFVVEEKFQFVSKDPFNSYHSYYSAEGVRQIKNKRKNKNFFNNHINQLRSYIYGINDYDIKYGYLVYWKYELVNGMPSIIACNILRIDKTDKDRQKIRETFITIKDLITNKGSAFDNNSRNPAKCANCVSSLLCGHKTGKFTSFSIPYSKHYLKTYYTKFPEELKKEI